ncbi:hypothetical protein ACJIZ3_016353 [Penstemon smallii]|uniref:Uncharacterized protein n=1 Tax=Penstemon smallii TaxID=265156 RepID=A0ABD3RUV0_9LAMI
MAKVAITDWNSIDSRIVINVPKWVDLSAPVDDEPWFCKPFKEDFFRKKERTPNSNPKLQRSASVSNIPPLGDRNKRDATLKKRGIHQPFTLINKDIKFNSVSEDCEDQDPNFSTPPKYKAKARKDEIKSSTERKQNYDNITMKEQTPKLRSTLSAKNLFLGGDILNKVAEFCTELKRSATKSKDEKGRKPLLELCKETSEVTETRGSKGKLTRKKNIKQQEAEGSLQIRTCPPTPQGFSASRGPLKATTLETFKSRPQERGSTLQELKHIHKEENYGGGGVEKEETTLDAF